MVGLDPTTQTFNIAMPEQLVGRVKPDHGEWRKRLPGQPPGHRRKPAHEIDDVLTECHWLAWEVMRLKPDTS